MPLSVSELTARIKQTLERQFAGVTVEGEISNWRAAASGHVYFTLKDKGATISAVIFRSARQQLDFQPTDGMQVLVRGAVSVYSPRGSYQIICEEMQLAGVGSLLQMLEERKQRLAREGLFDTEHKKELPRYPSRVAVVTSPTGAAIRDILQVMCRRNAMVNLIVLPTLVQGERAAATIAEQIWRANMLDIADAVIVTRGGGSLEDLLPFSDEAVVRAVAASKIPVISAVGHEIDFPLCDFAADVRAATPSAAAEKVTKDIVELGQKIATMRDSLTHDFEQLVEKLRLRLEQNNRAAFSLIMNYRLQPIQQRLDELHATLTTSMDNFIRNIRHRQDVAHKTLQAVAPASILKRGYAIVRESKHSAIVSDSGKMNVGDQVTIEFAESLACATIVEHNHTN